MPDFVDSSTNDFLAKSSALRRLGLKRDFFDATNPDHVASLKHYMETGNWLQQFYPEDPFTDVPMTVFRKYAGHQLGVLVTTQQKLDAKRDVKTPENIRRKRFKEVERSKDVERTALGFEIDSHEDAQKHA